MVSHHRQSKAIIRPTLSETACLLLKIENDIGCHNYLYNHHSATFECNYHTSLNGAQYPPLART